MLVLKQVAAVNYDTSPECYNPDGSYNYEACKESNINLPNMQPGLKPPNGIWLGANFEVQGDDSWADKDPITGYEEVWDVEIQLYRAFKGNTNYSIKDQSAWEWIQRGGIYFYNVHHDDWSEYLPASDGGSKNWEIRRDARAIKEIEPY